MAGAAGLDQPGEGGGGRAAAARGDGAAGGGGGDVVGGAGAGVGVGVVGEEAGGEKKGGEGCFHGRFRGVDWLRWRVRPASQVRVTAPAMA